MSFITKPHLTHHLSFFLILSATAAVAVAKCKHTCGSRVLPYPFGFSEDCPIQLGCTAPQNDIVLGKTFPVHVITPENIMISLKANCTRPIETMRNLFSSNFAPTSLNGLLLQDCASPVSTCEIPSTLIQTRFELEDCGKEKTISCYSETNKKRELMEYSKVERSECRTFFSAISVEYNDSAVVSLVVQAVELGWWLPGGCRCSPVATCQKVNVPPENGKVGFRCRCPEGYHGDGFLDGSGCRRAKSSTCKDSKYMCRGSTRIGLLVGGVVALMVICIGMLCCFIKRRHIIMSRKRLIRHLSEFSGIGIPIYAYKEIEKATDHFSETHRLGNGAYGIVYSGKLPNQGWVAIKRIKHADSTDRTLNEIKLLSSVNHPNLVRLLGCSIDHRDQILVYEFMPNGTLCQHLQRERSDGLSWPIRLKIALETARAIAHLHSSIDPPIYHRDIKSSNILLDSDFKSKVADFGMSRLGMPDWSHISTAPQGTPGYLDPQYHQDFQLSDKSDVYSFGVVLVEIITGLKAVDFSRPHNEVTLASLATDRIGRGLLEELLDPFLKPKLDPPTLTSIQKVAELAFRCLAFHRDMRPSMIEVATELEQINQTRSKIENKGTELEDKGSLSVTKKKPKSNSLGYYIMNSKDDWMSSMEIEDESTISMQDVWSSEHSSPGSNSLLANAIHQ